MRRGRPHAVWLHAACTVTKARYACHAGTLIERTTLFHIAVIRVYLHTYFSIYTGDVIYSDPLHITLLSLLSSRLLQLTLGMHRGDFVCSSCQGAAYFLFGRLTRLVSVAWQTYDGHNNVLRS